jgi:hypothetical protein
MPLTTKLFQSLILVLLAASIFNVAADDWVAAHRKDYDSANKKYHLAVFPEERRKDRPRAVFSVKGEDERYTKQTEFPLVNEVSPVNAVVSDGGEYFVTFDNWYRMGYGDDTVVIYRTDGTVVKKFGLKDLLAEGDISKLPRSVSSIWWGGAHYIDEQNGQLVLKVVSNGKNAYERDVTFNELRIELATGQPR